jgi:hypothetical protein
MSAPFKALATGMVGFLLGVASTSFVHGQGETVTGTGTRIGFAVRDVDKSAQKFTELFGVEIPPAKTLRDVPLGPAYHGKKMNVKYTQFTAFGMPMTLIQDYDGGGIYTDFIAKHGESFHHINLRVDNLPRARDFLLSKGAIRQAPVRADFDEMIDLEPMLPFGFDMGQAPPAR